MGIDPQIIPAVVAEIIVPLVVVSQIYMSYPSPGIALGPKGHCFLSIPHKGTTFTCMTISFPK